MVNSQMYAIFTVSAVESQQLQCCLLQLGAHVEKKAFDTSWYAQKEEVRPRVEHLGHLHFQAVPEALRHSQSDTCKVYQQCKKSLKGGRKERSSQHSFVEVLRDAHEGTCDGVASTSQAFQTVVVDITAKLEEIGVHSPEWPAESI